MKKSLSNFVVRILLAPLLCSIGLYFFNLDLFLYPLVFGIVIGILNFDKYKTKPLIGLLYGLVGGYLAFFLSYFSFFLLLHLKTTIGEDKANLIAIITAPNLLAPMLVFSVYWFVFKFKKSKFTFLIMALSIIVLMLSCITIYLNINLLGRNSINTNLIWQVIMALAIQLIIYQKEMFPKHKINS
ncbi:hypothetical protein [uncultured Tenacibaculum sp.]|uniref:hypothetical protein n=1 Tax=uncultured Tenacibaculum sp. TaxID=174713 RepID=UPI00262305F9|nr:hypothetical protein [uncultured Tenacibaculum sp.]